MPGSHLHTTARAVLVATFCAASLSVGAQAPGAGDAGENAFLKNCALCHVGQFPGNTHAPRLAQLRQLPLERVRDALLNGRMRPNTRFMSKAEIDAVALYVSSPAAAAPAAAAAAPAPTDAASAAAPRVAQ